LGSIALINNSAGARDVAGNALLLDALPSARGTVMALGSASIGGGAALGSLIGGGALSVFGDYADVYRLLGLLLPFAIVSLVVSTRVRGAGRPAAQTAGA
jgi:MFS family permease